MRILRQSWMLTSGPIWPSSLSNSELHPGGSTATSLLSADATGECKRLLGPAEYRRAIEPTRRTSTTPTSTCSLTRSTDTLELMISHKLEDAYRR